MRAGSITLRPPGAAPSTPEKSGLLDLQYLTTKQLAEKLGVIPRRVLALCQHRRIEPVAVVGQAKLWPPDAAERIGERRPGKPKAKAE